MAKLKKYDIKVLHKIWLLNTKIYKGEKLSKTELNELSQNKSEIKKILNGEDCTNQMNLF